jgi:hypothetical protein
MAVMGAPLLLGAMGLVMALWQPGRRGRWVWLAAFVLAGAAAFALAWRQQGAEDRAEDLLRQQIATQQGEIAAQQGQIARIAAAAGITPSKPVETAGLTEQIVQRLTPVLKVVGSAETTDNQDGTQTSKVTVDIDAPIPPAWLIVQMCGDGILALNFSPNQAIVAPGQSSQTGNCHLAKAQSPSGEWILEVRSKTGSPLPKLTYQFSR